MPQPRSDYQQLLNAASANATSRWLDCSLFGMFTVSVRTTFSVASLVGTLSFRGTNNFAEDATEPNLANGVLITPAITGITFSGAAGTVTYASPTAINTPQTIIIAFPQLPEKFQANWAFTSGGGTVSLIVTAAGWTV